MNANEAKLSSRIFKDRVGFYVMTSSQSVYRPGRQIGEDQFISGRHSFSKIADEKTEYAEAKRQAEATFVNANDFPTALVRFPLVLGTDDYTGRIQFHVNRILNGEDIFFPNISAQVSLISSDDAAESN